jgi:hypothetical protein
MIIVDGKFYSTITDAAKNLGGVSTKTIREWIAKGIIPTPPKIEWGVRTIFHFPPDYIEKAKVQLELYRKQKAVQGDKNQDLGGG